MLIPEKICDELGDDEMVSLALKDMDYFNCIVLRYGDRLARYIKRITSADDQEVEDVLQDAFINVWKNLNEYRHGLKLSSWLYRIVHNVAISRWRKAKTLKSIISENRKDIITVNYDDPMNEGLDEEILHNIIQRLDPKYRDVIVLKYFERLSYDEISDVLKIPEGTVAVRLSRGKKFLKSMIIRES